VALRRAAHQFLDDPKVLDDPIALPIIGAEAEAALRSSGKLQARVSRYLRAFMVVRSRFAEDQLARAIERGASQYVILGAGLDTFAYRNPHPESALRVFEVDHPNTQAWKQHRLAAAGIPIPPSVSFAPVNFEQQTLSEGLQRAGFRPEKITFFSWLGVTPYLTRAAVMATLGFIVATPRGGGVVFDYAVPRESLNWVTRMGFDVLARRVAAAGEPFQTFFDPHTLASELTSMEFRYLEDLGQKEINARYFRDRTDRLAVGGGLGRLMSAQI
jgi:methyltransferase (TIGR00027 family)